MSPEKQKLTFLSYSKLNKDFALNLAKELKAAGFTIWIDEIDIPTGARWDDEIEKALDTSDVFLVVLTPASISSENVKDEIGYAIDHGKRILPVLLEECKIPFRLRRFQYVDFSGKTYEEGVQAAKQLLDKLIGDPSEAQHGRVASAAKPGKRQDTVNEPPKGVAQTEPETLGSPAEQKSPVQNVHAGSGQHQAPASGPTITLTKPMMLGIGAVLIVIIAVVIGSSLFGGNKVSAEATPSLEVTSTATTTATPTTISPTPSRTPTITPTSAPSATPTFVPPITPFVRIIEITIDPQLNYVVEYETFGYTEKLPGTHVHFFFDTVPEEQAGRPGSGPWELYGGPRPFTEYAVSNRPAGATQMCALVANADHSIQPDSGNCEDLP